jgi:1-acyl-sn-glycerol-3-phosphate acyltransferase
MRDRAAASYPERIFRSSRLLLQLVSGILTVALLFPFYSRERRWRAIQRWSVGVCRIVCLEVRVIGAPAQVEQPILAVANHVSWLDIPTIHSVWRVRFVAKSEVRRWPAIGWLADRAGTLFIERQRRRHAASINRAIHEAFAAGDAIAVFPEGTTSDGNELLRFHASLLQPAVDEAALVMPIALRYLTEDGKVDVTPSYIGDRSLLESVIAVVSAPRLRAALHFLPPIDTTGRTRRELAELARQAISQALNLRD